LYAFFRDEGVIAVFHTDERGTGGISFNEERGNWIPGSPTAPPIIALAPEPYARLSRLVEKGEEVSVELDVKTSFHTDDLNGYNVVAEIPGRSKKKEIVMLGAHLDSWHGATGATDNAAGCAVVIEAVRILKTLDLPMARTVRLALWGGEEQGLFGSRGYVRNHFADPITMKLKKEHANLSGYFNLDNGSGKIRGVYLQGNDMMRPIFETWLAPFRDLGVNTISIRNTGGTDHLSFDAVGLPGFQFIQDPLEYSTRTHHSDLDSVDHVVDADLMQASAIIASLVYNAANRAEKLPREPLPDPLPPKRNAD
jgi:Zn-dependent M28 family amino/carboxypeptidase